MKQVLYIINCSLFLALLGACTEEYEYNAPATDNGGIYFRQDRAAEWVFGPDGAQTFSFKVARRDSAEAHTYRLLASDSECGIPSEVTFAAGKGTATVTATAMLPCPTLRRNVTITVAEGDRYVYGNPELQFTLSVASKVLECEKEVYSNNYIKEPCIVFEFGSVEEDGKTVVTYGAPYFLCEGFMMMFTLDDSGEANVGMQEALYAVPYIDGVTDRYLQSVEGTGNYVAASNKVEFRLNYFISGMNIYSIDGESITFPDGYNPMSNPAADAY